MWQGAVKRLCNRSKSCHVRKVARLLAQALIRYVFIAAYFGWCVAGSSSSGILLVTSRRRWPPGVGEPGRQPFCEADQDQHNHSAREHYAEEDNTCRQVRMSRQVFTEPPGAPDVCRIMRYSFAPALQEPDGGCQHDCGTDDHEETGETFLSASYHAHG